MNIVEFFFSKCEENSKEIFCLWLALNQRLPNVVRLQKFGIDCLAACVFCKAPVEILSHLLFECPITNTLGSCMLRWVGEHRQVGSWQEEVALATGWAKKRTGRGGIYCSIFAMVVTII